MYHWITIIYRKPIAALNTLWYFLETFPQERIGEITVFCDPVHKRQLKWFRERSAILLRYHQKKVPELNVNFIQQQEIGHFRKIVKEVLYRSDNKVVIDMTSGRKAHSALLLLMGELFSGSVDHVYYNFLHSEQFLKFPYTALPPGLSQIVDLLEK